MIARRTIIFSFQASSHRASCAFIINCLSTAELNPAQFFTLYSGQVQAGNVAMFGNEEEVTPFRCQTRNVQTPTGKLKAVLCARQYVKLPGLYDAVFRGATLGARNVGLVTTLSLSGASFDNVQTAQPALHGEHPMAPLGYIEILDAKGNVVGASPRRILSDPDRPRLHQ